MVAKAWRRRAILADAVLYRLAPEHPFPAAVEDAVLVYREVLKTYQPHNVGIFGTSSGAVLTAEVAVQLKQLGLPMPGALGIFSGTGDFSRNGDSQAFFTQHGLTGELSVPTPPKEGDSDYLGKANLQDPVVSPIYADLHGMPPTLFVTSTRDMLLSGMTLLHRAFLRVGVDARLIVSRRCRTRSGRVPRCRKAKKRLGLWRSISTASLAARPVWLSAGEHESACERQACGGDGSRRQYELCVRSDKASCKTFEDCLQTGWYARGRLPGSKGNDERRDE